MHDKPRISVDDIDRAPSSLPTQSDSALPKHDVDALRANFDRVSTEKFQLLDEINKLKQSNKTSEVLNDLVEPYANRAFIFMCCYCGIVALLLIASGWKIGGFELPSGVLEVLTGSTAVTVFGLVGMVLTGIFVGARKH